ncbi:hypothetical protein PGK05_04495 [Acinetobacter baumannii]|nr:hypothetical protein [Acinetobacter baumannii]
MLSITAQLLDVQTGDFCSLVFKGTKWDFGLQQEVPASVRVAVSKDHLYLVPSYQEAKGKMVSVEVKEGLTKSKQIWFRTSGTGQLVLQDN